MTPSAGQAPPFIAERKQFIQQIYDRQIHEREKRVERARYYYDNLKRLLRFIVEPGRRVLQIQCDIGHLLSAVQPGRGLGIHGSPGHIEVARRRHPECEFQVMDPDSFEIAETFNYVLLVNAVSDLVDVEQTLLRARTVCHDQTRVVLVYTNYLWQPIFKLAERLNLKTRQPALNWFARQDLANLLHLAGFEVIKEFHSLLLPVRIPILSWFLNRVVARLPPFHHLCYVKGLVARKTPPPEPPTEYSVSVIVPCKNEAGNVAAAVARIPPMGRHVEIIFCDDRSTDGTADVVRRMQKEHPDKDIKLVEGPGICKSMNVWTGFDAAGGDILMILDADLTTLPEELPYFYRALVEGKGEFINGSRLVYPMQENAMKPLNVLGNKMFSMAFSFLLGQPIKDTLCGTKVLWRRDYQRMIPLRNSWGVTDRWGDYELIFGAAKLNLKIIDLPVHYVERIYGETKMTKRLRNAAVMARMCVAAFLKLRFA
jgi:hypothetical protein